MSMNFRPQKTSSTFGIVVNPPINIQAIALSFIWCVCDILEDLELIHCENPMNIKVYFCPHYLFNVYLFHSIDGL